jgi:DNA-binding XRE family transcriptional regulator
MNYTNKIKSLLVLNGMKQSEMAQIIGVTEVTFSNKLNRKGNKKFDIDEALIICKTLNVTLNEIFLSKEVA